MGCCSSILTEDDTEPGYGALQVYRRQQRRWTTQIPLTRSQLEKERQEFWETIALYEGRPETWRAIRSALEETDRGQIQAILDASRLTVPSDESVQMTMAHIPGFDPRSQFTCYDHQGNRYVVPLQLISAPSNLIEDRPLSAMAMPAVDVVSGAAKTLEESHVIGEPMEGAGTDRTAAQDEITSHSRGESSKAASGKQQASRIKESSAESRGLTDGQASTGPSTDTIIRIRLSTTQKEHQLCITAPVITVGNVRQALIKHLEAAGVEPEKHRIRIFFLGRVLANEERLANIGHFEMGVNGTMLQAQITPNDPAQY